MSKNIKAVVKFLDHNTGAIQTIVECKAHLKTTGESEMELTLETPEGFQIIKIDFSKEDSPFTT